MSDFSALSRERLKIVADLLAGDGRPLADHLANGGELFDDQREALVKFLRGEVTKRPGNVRTFHQIWRELEAQQRVISLQWHYVLSEGHRGSFRKAKEAFLRENPGIGEESLKKYVKKGIPREVLKRADEIRAEVLRSIEAAQADSAE